MIASQPSHPQFENPPIVELALSVQFAPLTALRIGHFGLLWQRFRSEFPKAQEQAPLDRAIEEFEASARFGGSVRLNMLDQLPMPRCWFLNESETELIQIQYDRLIVNWRKGSAADQYPLFDRVLELFDRAYGWLASFVHDEQLGEIVPDQCEVTYVDHIQRGDVWQRHGELEEIFEVWTKPVSLPEPESARFDIAYVIPSSEPNRAPLGRLHIQVQPAYRRSDKAPIIVVNTTARGHPTGDGPEGVHGFFDIGHEWAVKAFVALTTKQLHQAWRKVDG